MAMSRYGPAFPDKNWVPAPRYILRRDRVLHYLSQGGPGNLLEIGYGSGALLLELAQRGFGCTGYEISPAARALAAEVIRPEHNIVLTDNPEPGWRAAFDYILAFEVLEHIEDDLTALTEWTHWLKRGGQVICSVPAHRHRWTPNDDWAGHYRRYDRPDLAQLCEGAGLKIVHLDFYGFPIANMIEPLRNAQNKRDLQTRQDTSRSSNNLLSGVARSLETRLFPYLDNALMHTVMQLGFVLQNVTRTQPWGNGLLAVAQKP